MQMQLHRGCGPRGSFACFNPREWKERVCFFWIITASPRGPIADKTRVNRACVSGQDTRFKERLRLDGFDSRLGLESSIRYVSGQAVGF